MARSKMDPSQITQTAYDEAAEAHRVLMVPTEMSMELSADDGDSVHAIPKMQVIQVQAGQVVDSSQAKVVTCVPEAQLTAVIGEVEVELPVVGMIPMPICTPGLKANISCTLILQS